MALPIALISQFRARVPEIAAYAKFLHPAQRYALVGCFLTKGAENVSAAITGLAERGAFRWLEAEKQLAATLDPAAIAKRPIAPGAVRHDHFASSEFRVSLAGEMLRRMKRDVSRADCLAH